jgi:hypothetical protein
VTPSGIEIVAVAVQFAVSVHVVGVWVKSQPLTIGSACVVELRCVPGEFDALGALGDFAVGCAPDTVE